MSAVRQSRIIQSRALTKNIRFLNYFVHLSKFLSFLNFDIADAMNIYTQNI